MLYALSLHDGNIGGIEDAGGAFASRWLVFRPDPLTEARAMGSPDKAHLGETRGLSPGAAYA